MTNEYSGHFWWISGGGFFTVLIGGEKGKVQSALEVNITIFVNL